jgi:signal peptidase II
LGLCTFEGCDKWVLLPVLQVAVLYNEGAAFSFLSDAGGWQRWFLLTLSSVVSVGIWYWLRSLDQALVWLRAGLTLVLAGAIGNLIDRASLGYVIDFVVVHWEDAYFPAFNVADAAISVGAICLIIDMFQQRGEPT